MDLIQLIGSRRKSDFAIYLAHTITALGERVLIVDSTNNNEYLHSYLQVEGNEQLYEFQNIEILINTHSMKELDEKLAKSNEILSNFDCIIVDSNDSSTIFNDWPNFQHVFYISDNTRFNITRDIEILNNYADSTGKEMIQRIHFESAHKIPNDYLDLLINNRLEFKLVEEPLEYDDQEHKLRNYMQHENDIPYSKLPKDYKRILKSIVTEIYDIGNKDFEASTKKRPLEMLFGRFKNKKKNNGPMSKNDDSTEDDQTAQPRLILNNISQCNSNKSDDTKNEDKAKEVVGR